MIQFIGANKIPNTIVKLIYSNPVLIPLFSLLILVTGLTLDIKGLNLAFPRSGAVLVCLALTCVYSNHLVGLHSRTLTRMAKSIEPLGQSFSEIYQNLNPIIQGDQRIIAAHSIFNVNTSLPETKETYNKTQIRLLNYEYLAGILGTIVWAFGDLI